MKRFSLIAYALLFSIVMMAQSADKCYNKGLDYRFGRNGVRKDYVEAVKWYRKAAEKGHAGAQTNLGYMYHNGYGVQRDDAEAVKWYREAAEQGYALGQNNLGYMYQYGYGVQKDFELALYWYQKAIAQGEENAMAGMGELYEYGFGVAQDYEKAKEWYQKALATRPTLKDAKDGLARVGRKINWNATIEGIRYSVNSGGKTAKVVGKGNIVDVNIPETIVYNGVTCRVTSIEEKAFSGCKELTSVTIPNSVTEIPKECFSGCISLKAITIPGSVIRINEGAFYGCDNLSTLVISEGVQYIEANAFRKCKSLVSVKVPDSVVAIEDYAFYECDSLKSFVYPDNLNRIGRSIADHVDYDPFVGALDDEDLGILKTLPTNEEYERAYPNGRYKGQNMNEVWVQIYIKNAKTILEKNDDRIYTSFDWNLRKYMLMPMLSRGYGYYTEETSGWISFIRSVKTEYIFKQDVYMENADRMWSYLRSVKPAGLEEANKFRMFFDAIAIAKDLKWNQHDSRINDYDYFWGYYHFLECDVKKDYAQIVKELNEKYPSIKPACEKARQLIEEQFIILEKKCQKVAPKHFERLAKEIKERRRIACERCKIDGSRTKFPSGWVEGWSFLFFGSSSESETAGEIVLLSGETVYWKFVGTGNKAEKIRATGYLNKDYTSVDAMMTDMVLKCKLTYCD